MSETTTVRRCALEDIGTVTIDGDEPAEFAPLRRYFGQFAAPIVPENANLLFGARCLCGEPLTGLFGTFTYGLAHGEGYCGKCGHPGRADHYPTDDAGAEILALNRFPLLYHPDDLVPADQDSAPRAARAAGR